MSGLPVAGAWAMIIVAALLLVASLMIGWDGLKAYHRYSELPPVGRPVSKPSGKPAIARV